MSRRKLSFECLEDRRVLDADFNMDETVDQADLDRWAGGFGTVGTAAASQGDSDGDSDVDGSDFLDWQRMLGPDRTQLVAYRPQGVYDPDDTQTGSPIYDPFPKRAVPEQNETSNTLGPGIRINADDDDADGVEDRSQGGAAILRENDLIEVRVDRLLGTGDLILVPSFPLALYYDHDKDTIVPLNEEETATEPLDFAGSSVSVFVEWRGSNHGFANLSLVDPATSTTIDTVRFHSFRSIIIAFGGNGQNPLDTDGDGSIGDPVDGGPNREGLFDIAQSLYDTGWDVLAFDEEDVDAADDVPYTEVINALQNRFVEAHGIIGYSQGGGATHDLIERLWDDNDIITRIGVFLDAVDHDGAFAENDWPDVAFYLLSIYQDNEALSGDDIDDSEVIPGATLEEINTTTDPGWNNTLDHSEIDDDLQAHQLIRQRLLQYLVNR